MRQGAIDAKAVGDSPLDAARRWRQESGGLASRVTMDWRRHVLANGLTVLLQPDPTMAFVHVCVAYRVGSMEERTGQTGLAHFFEHMMFGGTRTLPGGYLRRMTDAGALEVNAMTSRDTTRYYQTVPAHLLDFVLFAEADRMRDFAASLDPAVVERERSVVLEEKAQGEARPLGKFPRWIAEGLTPFGHPYHHTTIGYGKDIQGYTLQDIVDWHDAHYGPENAVVMVGGAMDPDRTLATIERYFGAIRPGAPLQRVLSHTPPPRRGALRVADRISEPAMYAQAWSTPSAVSSPREQVALAMVADLLGGGSDSELYERLVAKEGLATVVGVSCTPGRAMGIFLVHANLKAPADGRVKRSVEAVVSAFKATPIDAERLEGTRVRLLSASLRSLASLERRATVLVDGEALHGDAGWFAEEARLIATLSGDEIREAARRWLCPDSFSLSIDQVRPPGAAAPHLDLGPPPPIGGAQAVTVSAPEFETAVLRSGASLRLSRRPGDPTFQLRAVGKGGRAYEPAGREGLAEIAASIPDFGAGPDDPAMLAGRVSRAGLKLHMTAGFASSRIEIGGLANALGACVALLADMLLHPRFGSPEQFRVSRAREASAVARVGTPAARFDRTFNRMLLGPLHRASAPLPSAPGVTDTLTADEIAAFHAAAWTPTGVDILIAGDFDLREVVALLDGLLEGWASLSAIPSLPRFTLDRLSPGIRLVHAPGLESATVRLGWRPDVCDVEGYLALESLNHALAGHFTSRANRNLREEKGWSYGVSSRAGEFVPGVGPAFGAISTQVGPERAGAALAELFELTAALRSDDPVTADEVEAFRRSERQSLARLNETAASAVEVMQFMQEQNYTGMADWIAYSLQVERLTPQHLQRDAHIALPAADQIACVLMGDAAQLSVGLEEAGLGSLIVEDEG